VRLNGRDFAPEIVGEPAEIAANVLEVEGAHSLRPLRFREPADRIGHGDVGQARLDVFFEVARRLDNAAVAEDVPRTDELAGDTGKRNTGPGHRLRSVRVNLLLPPGQFQRLQIAFGEVERDVAGLFLRQR